MIQTLNTLSLIFAIVSASLVVIALIIFFSWKIRDVRGFLSGKTKADALAVLREETNASKRYAVDVGNLEVKNQRVETNENVKSGQDSTKDVTQDFGIESPTTEFTSEFGDDDNE